MFPHATRLRIGFISGQRAALHAPTVLLENVSNVDGTSVLLSAPTSMNVLVGQNDFRKYRGDRVQQRWITAIECMSGHGRSLPLLISAYSLGFIPTYSKDPAVEADGRNCSISEQFRYCKSPRALSRSVTPDNRIAVSSSSCRISPTASTPSVPYITQH